MTHHTKDKGDLGVLKAQLDLFEKGFIVSVPLTEHAPFDLVVTRKGVSKTVQVKTRCIDERGCLYVSFKSSWADKHGTHIKYVDKSNVDWYCVYCPDTDECYYFDPKKYNKSLTLRVEAPKNNQSKRINLVKDFREVP